MNLPQDRFFWKKSENWKTVQYFGIWNVRTLFKRIKIYGIRVAALQEIRWKDLGTISVNDKIFIYSDCTDQRQLETGYTIHKNLIPTVNEFRSISPRNSLLIVVTKWIDISFVCVHAPTEEKPQDEKDIFYDKLETTLNSLPSNRIQFVLGNFNAEVGKETVFRSIVDSYYLHNESNNNGLILIDLTSENGLVIKSTMLPLKNIHKRTCTNSTRKNSRELNISEGLTLGHLKLGLLAYADNVTIIGEDMGR